MYPMSKEHTYNLRLSDADKTMFKGAADIAGMPLAEWLRMLGREEARRVAEKQGRESVYGYCPLCGAPGVSRERRMNGTDMCDNGHLYPSKECHERTSPSEARKHGTCHDRH